MSTKQIHTLPVKVRQFATELRYFLIVFVLMGALPTCVLAQDSHSQHQQPTADLRNQRGELIQAVRAATARFRDVNVAEYEGYHLEFGCVSGPDSGAMGLHYVNDTIVSSGVIDVTRPQIVLYEAQPNGNLKLTGADYLVLAEPWDKKHPGTPPQLMGQIFHYFEAPNRFGLPAFYTLHVWAWKDNPNGAFVNWHPDVSCQSFVGDTTK